MYRVLQQLGKIAIFALLCIFLLTTTVKASEPKTVLSSTGAKTIRLVSKNGSVVIGGAKKIKIKNASTAKITYKSNRTSIATVSKKGKIKGIRNGSAKITVFVRQGNKKTKLLYKITVKKPKLSKSRLSLIQGRTAKLAVKNKPRKAKYAWSTTDKKIAVVGKKGEITAKSPGITTVRLRVKTAKKNYILSCRVTVKSVPDKPKPTITVTPTPTEMPSTEREAIYYSPLDERHVTEAEFTDIDGVYTALYVDNEIILKAADSATKEQIEQLVSRYQGSITGYIEAVNYYQIELKYIPVLTELYDLIEKLRTNKLVEDAYLNMVSEMENNLDTDYPDDEWGGDTFDENHPHGKNWGLEAINVRSAWALLEDRATAPVNVGVIDQLFDMTHEDLDFKEVWQWNTPLSKNTNKTAKYAANAKNEDAYEKFIHGTFVSGIISAKTHNSGIGISGIAPNANLYAVSIHNIDNITDKSKKGTFGEYATLSRLIQSGSPRIVINVSQGYNDVEKIPDDLPERAKKLSNFLQDYLKRGNDFVIVVAAGNERDASTKNPERNTVTNNNIFCAITKEMNADVFSRIIVVGAAEKRDFNPYNYEFHAEYLSGNRIDVVAPGIDIFSTAPAAGSPSINPDGSYYKANGTSAAAPHVSGEAALLWSASPKLKGNKIKEIICNTADIELGSGADYKMINVAHAVAYTLNQTYSLGGQCGDGVTWTLDLEKTTLTILKNGTGTGEMYDYDQNENIETRAPWNQYRGQIKKVVIEDGVLDIGAHAFSNLANLERVEIGKDVRIIGDYAFNSCYKLATISTFPSSLKEIGQASFYDTSLTEIQFEGNAPLSVYGANMKDGNGDLPSFYNKESGTEGVTLYYNPQAENWDLDENGFWNGYYAVPFQKCGEQVYWALDNGVLNIWGEGDMYDYSTETISPWKSSDCHLDITAIIIHKGVTSIGEYAFEECNNLLNVTIPDSISIIGDGAFADCANLPSISIPGSVTKIGTWGGAFEYCSSLTNVDIANGVTVIGMNAFRSCISLKNVNIPDSVTTIGDSAFADCTNLTDMNIPNSVTGIGAFAFIRCTNLSSINLPDCVTYIGSYVFEECFSLTSVDIPDGATFIGIGSFMGCSSLTRVSIPDSVTEIGMSAFDGCANLTNIDIPKCVTEISDRAFRGCSGFSSIDIPGNVSKIGEFAFGDCTNLVNANIFNPAIRIGASAFPSHTVLNYIH